LYDTEHGLQKTSIAPPRACAYFSGRPESFADGTPTCGK